MNKSKTTAIFFRISKLQKDKWKNICKVQKINLTDLIISSVENRFLNSERREILKFIEKQDNIFSKIENNINQFARYANSRKGISDVDLIEFNKRLTTIEELKLEQNKMFEKIYSLIAKPDDC